MNTLSPSRGQGDYPGLSRLAQLCQRPVWVVDLEATGGDLSNPEFGVVEIGWVLVRADGSWEEGSHLTDPGFPMDPYAQRLTGISREMYQGAPSIQARWDEVGPLFLQTLVCGFGVEDLDCKALARAGGSLIPEGAKIQSLDTRKLWIKHSGAKKGRLLEVAQAFGYQDAQSHRALADSRACAHAMEGLIQALGEKTCLALARSWMPGVVENPEEDAALKRGAVVQAALEAARDAGSFVEGMRALAQAGARAHWAPKGLSWWVEDRRAEWPEGPRNVFELGAHFGAQAPASMAQLDSLARARAALGQASAQGLPIPSDDELSLMCVCRPSSAGTTRINMIRSGELPPWAGVDPGLREFVQERALSSQSNSEIFNAARAQFPHATGPELGACAASLDAKRPASKPPKP